MSVFIIQMIVIFIIDKHAHERSHVPDSARQSKTDRYVSRIANLSWLSAMVYSVFLPLYFGTIWFYSGFFVFIIGVILLVLATIAFVTTPAGQLIDKGIYKFSRHPMYLATFLICIGSGIASVSITFIVITIIMTLCLYVEARIEESHCLHIYGKSYRDYMIRVSRWIGIHTTQPGK